MVPEESLKIGLEVALSRFEDERKRQDALDTKASIAIGFAGALIGIILNVVLQKPQLLAQLPAFFPLILLVLAGPVFAFLAALFALLAIRIQSYVSGPGDKILLHAIEQYTTQELRQQLVKAYAQAYFRNWKHNQQKAKLIQTALNMLVISASSTTLATLIYLWIGK